MSQPSAPGGAASPPVDAVADGDVNPRDPLSALCAAAWAVRSALLLTGAIPLVTAAALTVASSYGADGLRMTAPVPNDVVRLGLTVALLGGVVVAEVLLLRARGRGPTLIVSPLLALMRVRLAARLGRVLAEAEAGRTGAVPAAAEAAAVMLRHLRGTMALSMAAVALAATLVGAELQQSKDLVESAQAIGITRLTLVQP